MEYDSTVALDNLSLKIDVSVPRMALLLAASTPEQPSIRSWELYRKRNEKPFVFANSPTGEYATITQSARRGRKVQLVAMRM
ncbi:hypothetical protein HG15A2_21440 [Adhaeretor mobilis]|uniref:Uncharacterized protein n=1 Tax=Adhaeretor mobilis TaxID=1930276 RepID=A0A517MVF4_9BACT|nr:hypothetical protein HG15A2_21440 [Adhaeretor mobilis]